jgi:hypothetical protein
VALESLTDEEVEQLEGSSREAAIRRIRALENVQRQLTGVLTQLTQIVSAIDSNESVDEGPSSSQS